MRKILFRAKDAIGDKGWVYGDLVHNKKVTETDLKDRIMVNGYEVKEETVCQFTGMYDKNGMQIFEGDIISTEAGFGSINYVVKYDERIASFRMYRKEKLAYSLADAPLHGEVIGNKFDNPNLVRL